MLLAVLLGLAQEVVAALVVLRQPQPAWHLSTTSASLLSNVEVHEDMPEPRRVVLLLPLRRVNSDHLVRLEEEALRLSVLVVSPTLPSMVASTTLPPLVGARTPTTKTPMMFWRMKKQ